MITLSVDQEPVSAKAVHYIARDNEEAADRVYQAAENTFEILADFPHMGTRYIPGASSLRVSVFFL